MKSINDNLNDKLNELGVTKGVSGLKKPDTPNSFIKDKTKTPINSDDLTDLNALDNASNLDSGNGKAEFGIRFEFEDALEERSFGMPEDIDDNSKDAINYAMKYLLSGDKTEGQVRKKLKDKEFEEADINIAIDYVKDFHYIDDYRYALNFIELNIASKSKLKLKEALLKRFISTDIIDNIFEEHEFDDSLSIKKEVKTILDKLHIYNREAYDALEYKEKQKIIAKLCRKGYSVNTAINGVDSYFDETFEQ